MTAFQDYQNEDGTFDGTRAFADFSGIPLEEVRWTAARMRELIVTEGMPKDEAIVRVREERKSSPWREDAA